MKSKSAFRLVRNGSPAAYLLATAIGSLLAAHLAFADTRTWDNGDANFLWGDPVNWDLDATIPAAADTAVFNVPAGSTSLAINLGGAARTISGLTASVTATAAYTFANGLLVLNTITTAADGRANRVTIAADVADQSNGGLVINKFNGDGGYLTLAGRITIGSTAADAFKVANIGSNFGSFIFGSAVLPNSVAGGVLVADWSGGDKEDFQGAWTVGGDFNVAHASGGRNDVTMNPVNLLNTVTIGGKLQNASLSGNAASLVLGASSSVVVGGDVIVTGKDTNDITINKALLSLGGSVKVYGGSLKLNVTDPIPSKSQALLLGDTAVGTTNAAISINTAAKYLNNPITVQSGSTGTATLASGSTTIGTINKVAYVGNITVNKDLIVNASTTANAVLDVAGAILSGGGTQNLTINSAAQAGTVWLSGANTYTGTTTVNGGVATFRNQAALYGGTTTNWTPTNLTISAGATLGIGVGDSGYFASGDIDTLLDGSHLGLSAGTTGLKTGSNIGFDSSNASGGSFTYASNIVDPAGGSTGLGIVKLGDGMLVLSGNNSGATGNTTVSVGTLRVSAANNFANGTVTLAGGMLDLRNDTGTNFGKSFTVSATPTTINVDQAVGGSGTNGTHTMGTMSIGAQTLNVTGANGYSLAVGATTLTGAATLNPITANLMVDSVTATNQNLTLSGPMSGNTVGAITTGTGTLTKSGIGTWTVGAGSSTYSGATAINAGLLRIDGTKSGAGAITIAKNGLLGGGGSVTGAVTAQVGDAANFGGSINLANGIAGTTLTLTNATTPLTLSGTAANPNGLYFDLGSGTVSDAISLTGTPTATNAGGTLVFLNPTTTLTGPYNVIQGTTAMSATGYALATTRAGRNLYGLAASGNNLQVSLGAGNAGDPTPNEYWFGSGSSVWNVAQWYSDSTHLSPANTPGYSTNVVFAATGATNLVSTLGQDYEINSLTVSSGLAATSISGNMLTIDATGDNSNTANNGITVNNTAGTTIASKVGLAASQIWTVGSGAGLTVSGFVTDFGAGYTLTKAGNGTLTLSNANYYSGGTVVTGGTLMSGNLSTAFGTGPITLNNGTTFQPNGGGTPNFGNAFILPSGTATLNYPFGSLGADFTISGPISGAGALVLTSDNSGRGIILSGPKTFSGGLTQTNVYNNGASTDGVPRLTIDNIASLGTGTFHAQAKSTNLTLAYVANSADLSGGLGVTNPIQIDGGVTSRLVLNVSNNMLLSGVIGGGGYLVKRGTATLTLTGANNYTGATMIGFSGDSNAGTLKLFGAGKVSNAAMSAFSGTLDLNGTTQSITTLDLAGGAAATTAGVSIGAGELKLGGDVTYLAINAANNPNAGSITGSGLLSLYGNRMFTVYETTAAVMDLTIGANIQDGDATARSLAKAGSGILLLAGANTYTGGTNIYAGSVDFLTAAAKPGTGVINVSPRATLGLGVGGAGYFSSTDLNNLFGGTLSGVTTAANSLVGIDTTAGDFAYTVPATTLGLTKFGPNRLTISGNSSSFAGPTSILGGTLAISADTDLGAAGTTVVMDGGAMLDTGAGTLTLNNRLVNIGPLNGAITNAAGGSLTLNGVVGGTGGLTKGGLGTLALAGVNTYSGGTTVTGGGTLDLQNENALRYSTLTMAGNGTVVFDSSVGSNAFTIGGLAATTTGAGYDVSLLNSSPNPITLTVGRNNAATTYNGVLSGAGGSFIKTGTGTLTLSGATVNTFTGGLTVNMGTVLENFGNLPTPTDLINSGNVLTLGAGTLSLTAKNNAASLQTFASTTLSANRGSKITLTKTGTGTMSVDLKAITRNTGSTLNFTAVPDTSNIIATTTTGNTNDILGSWAVVGAGGTGATALQYATVSGGQIIRYPDASAVVATPTDLSNMTGATTNYSLAKPTGGTTLTGSVTANTLRVTSTSDNPIANNGNSITLNSLIGVGANRTIISGAGNLVIGDTRELVIHWTVGFSGITCPVVDNPAGDSSVVINIPQAGEFNFTGANTYKGGTTINAVEQLNFNVNSFGSGPVTVNGGVRFRHLGGNLTNALTLNGTILHSGGTYSGPITLVTTSSAEGTAGTISGDMSGPGGFAVSVSAGNVQTFSGTNSYTGPTSITSGTGMFSKAASLYSAVEANWTPANISVASGATLRLRVGGTGEFTPVQVGTLITNLTTGVANNGLKAGSTIYLDPFNAGGIPVEIAADITDSTGPGGGAVNLTIGQTDGSPTNTVVLSGANTYSGQTTIDRYMAVNLSVSSFNSVFTNPALGTVHSASSSLGAPTIVANGTIKLLNEVRDVALIYTGGGETTDRVINYASSSGNLTLDQSGSGLLKFVSPITSNTGRSLTLRGSMTGAGEIAAAIGTNFDGGIIKNGTGTWTLSGANAYTGTTTVSAGTLLINGANNGSGAVNVGTSGTLGGTGTIAGAVNVTGVLSPGASIGTLTSGALSLANNSTYQYQVNSSVATSVGGDLHVVNGALSLAAAVTLNLADIGAGSIAGGTVFSLFNYSGAWNSGIFTYLSTPLSDDTTSFSFAGKTWTIDYNATTKGANVSGTPSGSYVNIIAAGVSLTPYETWIQTPAFAIPGGLQGAGLDADSDGVKNVNEFAFDTLPNSGGSGPGVIAYSGASVTAHGQPIMVAGAPNKAVFGRRLTAVADGLSYTLEFSADLVNWETSGATPTQIATDATLEAVSVAYPATITTPGGGTQVPHFFRVLVSLAP